MAYVARKSEGQEPEKQPTEVNLMGQRLVLKAEHSDGHIERLEAYVRRKLDEVSARGPISGHKLALITALNIADDYFRALEEGREFKREVANRCRALLEQLPE